MAQHQNPARLSIGLPERSSARSSVSELVQTGAGGLGPRAARWNAADRTADKSEATITIDLDSITLA
jgi:hypothetical protein